MDELKSAIAELVASEPAYEAAVEQLDPICQRLGVTWEEAEMELRMQVEFT